QGPRHTDFYAAIEGSHHATAGAQGADDFVSQSARVFDVVAMHAMRLRGELPELQRIANVSSARPKAGVPCMRAHGAGAGGLAESEVQEPGDTLLGAGHGKGRGRARQIISRGAYQANGFGRAKAEGRLSAHPWRFSCGQDGYSRGHADDREGAAFSE